MKTNRNIGGSLLPSSSPEILKPINCPFGVLQVKPQPEADTHALYLGDKIIASHPNGFSCHTLAIRIKNQEWGQAAKQAGYIVACGGKVDLETIVSLALRKEEAQP